jgi:hypothetical protein
MDSELGVVLREQQAVLSLLLNRVALVNGAAKRAALDEFAGALLAHLSQWRSVLLPAAGKSELAQRLSASGAQIAMILACTRVNQTRVGGEHSIQALMRSLLSLISQERTLLSTTLSALPIGMQLALAGESEDEFLRHGGPAEREERRLEHADAD